MSVSSSTVRVYSIATTLPFSVFLAPVYHDRPALLIWRAPRLYPPRMRATSMLRSEGVLVLGLALFVAVVWIIEHSLGISTRTTVGALPGLVLALVPAILWLAFFYQQD